jgi:hypothetical protein
MRRVQSLEGCANLGGRDADLSSNDVQWWRVTEARDQPSERTAHFFIAALQHAKPLLGNDDAQTTNIDR